MLHIPGFLKFCGRNNGERNRQLEGYSARHCAFEERCANSRWLSNGSDHNITYNYFMWPDSILTILCYFLAAIPLLKVSFNVYVMKHVLTSLTYSAYITVLVISNKVIWRNPAVRGENMSVLNPSSQRCLDFS